MSSSLSLLWSTSLLSCSLLPSRLYCLEYETNASSVVLTLFIISVCSLIAFCNCLTALELLLISAAMALLASSTCFLNSSTTLLELDDELLELEQDEAGEAAINNSSRSTEEALTCLVSSVSMGGTSSRRWLLKSSVTPLPVVKSRASSLPQGVGLGGRHPCAAGGTMFLAGAAPFFCAPVTLRSMGAVSSVGPSASFSLAGSVALKAVDGDQLGGMGSSSWTGVWQACTGGTVASPCLLAGLSVNVTVDDEESFCLSSLPDCTWDWRQLTSNPGPNCSSPLLRREDNSCTVGSTGG